MLKARYLAELTAPSWIFSVYSRLAVLVWAVIGFGVIGVLGVVIVWNIAIKTRAFWSMDAVSRLFCWNPFHRLPCPDTREGSLSISRVH